MCIRDRYTTTCDPFSTKCSLCTLRIFTWHWKFGRHLTVIRIFNVSKVHWALAFVWEYCSERSTFHITMLYFIGDIDTHCGEPSMWLHRSGDPAVEEGAGRRSIRTGAAKKSCVFGMALYVVYSLIQKNRRLFFPAFLVHTVLISTSSAAETISMRVCISGSRSRWWHIRKHFRTLSVWFQH